MSVSTFAVVPEAVRKKHLPALSAYSTSSAPTTADVADFINEAAGDLEGRLNLQGVSITSIAAQPPTTAAYLWCVKYIRMYAAVEAIAAGAQCEAESAKRLSKKLSDMQTALEDNGTLVLGEGAAPTTLSDPSGLVTTEDMLGLDTGDDADASDLEPPFRKDDPL